jgi:hypothetical protein
VRIVRLPDNAAFASNWRAVLGLDLCLAVVVIAAGAAAIGFGHPLGFVALVAGVGYGALVVRRWRRWRRLRSRAGL